MSKRFFIALVVVWTAAIGLVEFSMLRPDGAADPGPRAASGPGEQTQEAQQETGRQDSGAKTTKEATRRETKSSGGPGRATLEVGGEPGVSFSGRCVVDGEERRISGESPETFTYEPDERIECEISSRGGPLRVSFSDGEGTNTTQTVGPGESTLELTYTEDSLSSSTRSSSQTGGSQTSSSQSSSQTSSSQSVSQSSSSSVTQSGAE